MSSSLYNVDGWGAPYFFANAAGDIAVPPHGAATLAGQEIDIAKVVAEAAGPRACSGLSLTLPLLVRSLNALRHRLKPLQASFEFTILSDNHGSHYQGVKLVKCNQTATSSKISSSSANTCDRLRVKQSTKHVGRFGSTSDEKGKFGLSAAQIFYSVKGVALQNRGFKL